MTLKTQYEIEMQMYYGGIKRAESMMAKAEESGNADRNPYARGIMDDYVLPIATRIRKDCFEKTRGVQMAHVRLLGALDPDAVAFIGLRTALNGLMTPRREHNHRSLAAEIGRAVHCELVLAQLEEAAPELYYTLSRDLGRRLSKNERHRMTVFKMQAKRAGIEWAEWPLGSRDQVGMYLMGLMEQAGILSLSKQETSVAGRSADGRRAQKYCDVFISDDLLKRIDEVKAHVSITTPVYGPCVEPPIDWTSPTSGGFHTRELRRTHPFLVRASASSRDIYRHANMPVVLRAVNTLQRVGWRVNTRVLDVVMETGKVSNTGEIVSLQSIPKPDKPECVDKEDKSPEEVEVFKRWKRQMAEWYTERKLTATRYGRFYSATRAANMFRDYPEIFFVYFADSRGRLYPMTYGLNPQGSDLQRGLLTFSVGKPVRSDDAIRWFKIQGANKYGYDKATFDERVAWVDERSDMLYAIGSDPMNNLDWQRADNPIQFLAWCIEYASWLVDRVNFRSYLPISMDGSCNGLQHLSAMMRDEVGGKATNLMPADVMSDIYGLVAKATVARMQAAEDSPMRTRWLAHGVNRSVVKRSVMTTPYGVTRRSATEYVISDYLRDNPNSPFDRSEWREAAGYLMTHCWPAIGDVIVRGRIAMDWLRKAAKLIIVQLDDEQEPLIQWTAPSGFPATQAYFEVDMHRIRTRLHGMSKVRVVSESDDPDLNKHASGMAPNFVHSMDAAHLHLTTAAAAEAGVTSLAMIHDDYGTHAADAETLFRLIRQEFVGMYTRHDPLQELADRYPEIGTPPAKGSLDVTQVLSSTFFFA